MNLNATLAAQMVVFFILWWAVARLIWSPLVEALDERAKKIADGLTAADKGKAELELANKRVKQALTEARDENAQRIADAEKRAQIGTKEIRQNVQTKTARIIAQIRTETEQQAVRVRESLRGQVATLAVKSTEQIFKREIDAQVHTDLFNQLKTKL